jgi:hypothetical protein
MNEFKKEAFFGGFSKKKCLLELKTILLKGFFGTSIW